MSDRSSPKSEEDFVHVSSSSEDVAPASDSPASSAPGPGPAPTALPNKSKTLSKPARAPKPVLAPKPSAGGMIHASSVRSVRAGRNTRPLSSSGQEMNTAGEITGFQSINHCFKD